MKSPKVEFDACLFLCSRLYIGTSFNIQHIKSDVVKWIQIFTIARTSLALIMAKDQESKESQALDNTKGQLSFVIFDQASSSNGSNSRRIRSHAARRGWTVRKENSKKKTKTLADGPRSDLANPISLASAPPARESRSRRKLQREGNARRNRNRGFLETVLNEEYPIGLSFGSPSNPFSVYPVPWKPVFAPLIDFCE